MSLATRARRIAAAGAVAVTAAVAALLAVPAAQAATPEILVSDDGVSFAPTLTDGLFDGLGLLVPGESISASLWVRNPSSTDGSLRLTIDDLVTPSQVFADNVTLTADSGNLTWSWSLADLEDCGAVVPTLAIGAGDTVRIDLTAALGDVSGLDAQNESASVGLSVIVRDAVNPFPNEACAEAPVDPTDPDDGDGNNAGGGSDGSLSGTGADIGPTLWVALALLAGGFVIVIARRRRRDEDEA